jgi:2-amino-4-hydroxy-6-hydroxymethyldihydropteridine diphosphokinase
MKIVYLGLGSNLGDRERHLDAAITHLNEEGIRVRRRSSIYETAPQELTTQPWFLNMVVEAETSLFPRQLLARILRIEANLGRRRHISKGPRVIDIDILLHGSTVLDTEELTIPHPSMLSRRFVLEPLVELVPDLRHPVTGDTFQAALSRTRDQEVLRRS